jgi:hypothetical protein
MTAKVHESAQACLAQVVDDSMTIALGGFGLCGSRIDLSEALSWVSCANAPIVSPPWIPPRGVGHSARRARSISTPATPTGGAQCRWPCGRSVDVTAIPWAWIKHARRHARRYGRSAL